MAKKSTPVKRKSNKKTSVFLKIKTAFNRVDKVLGRPKGTSLTLSGLVLGGSGLSLGLMKGKKYYLQKKHPKFL